VIENRSAPPGTVVPRLIYRDVGTAIRWLCGAFGFYERLRTPAEEDGSIHHAQLGYGEGALILTADKAFAPAATQAEFRELVMIRVRGIDEHFARAKAYGAKIVSDPKSYEYGERQYVADDLEGKRWTFTESVADRAPEEWGGTSQRVEPRVALLARPRVCYLEIPARDARKSAAFYKNVFGWNIRHADTERPSFDDATGIVSGAFVLGREATREPGLLVHIWVDDLRASVAAALANGGEMLQQTQPDRPGGTSWYAVIRDVAGNALGLYQENYQTSAADC